MEKAAVLRWDRLIGKVALSGDQVVRVIRSGLVRLMVAMKLGNW